MIKKEDLKCKRTFWSKEKLQNLCYLLEMGLTEQQIARKLGKSRESIKKAKIRYIKKETRWEPKSEEEIERDKNIHKVRGN